jgi:hypothetical protein
MQPEHARVAFLSLTNSILESITIDSSEFHFDRNMTQLLMTATGIKRTDVTAVQAGISFEVLMKTTGRAVADAVWLELPKPHRVFMV